MVEVVANIVAKLNIEVKVEIEVAIVVCEFDVVVEIQKW